MSVRTIAKISAFVAVLTLLPGAGWAAKIVWNYSVWGPKRAYTSGIEDMKASMEKASNGSFEMKISYGDALGPRKQNLDSIKIGVFEAASTCVGYHPHKLPLLSVMELPFLLPGDPVARAKVQLAVQDHPEIKKEMAKRWNARFLASGLLPSYEFMGNRRIAKAEDFNGVKVRISGLNAMALKEFGAVPTMIGAAEGYQALERGTIDDFGFPWTYAFGAYKLYEVSKYATVGVGMSGFECLSVANIDAWNKLPENIRKKSVESRWHAVDVMIKRYKEADDKYLPVFKKRLELVPFPASERKKLISNSSKIWAKWVKDQEDAGRPGKKMLEFVEAQVAKYSS